MLYSVIFSILSSIRGQLGPNYDPLFYDVILYTIVGVIFLIILIVVIVVVVKNRKGEKNIQYQESSDKLEEESEEKYSDEKKWDGI